MLTFLDVCQPGVVMEGWDHHLASTVPGIIPIQEEHLNEGVQCQLQQEVAQDSSRSL